MENSVRNRGYIRVDFKTLAEALRLPPGVEILGVRQSDPYVADALDVGLEGPGLPEVPEGEVTPLVRAIIRVEQERIVEMTFEEMP